jgi:hypothetical protein
MQESLEKIAPTWMNVSLTMKNDPETDKAFGWVLEMLAQETRILNHELALHLLNPIIVN